MPGGSWEVTGVEELLTSAANYGFPMVVAIYLLVRVERKLEELTRAIAQLGQVMESAFR